MRKVFTHQDPIVLFTGKVVYLFLEKHLELKRLHTKKKKIPPGLKDSKDLGNCIQILQIENNERVVNFDTTFQHTNTPSLKFPTVKNWQ